MIRSGQFADLPQQIRLHFASAGQPGRPLLLFLHGFPEYWGAWEELLPQFADDFFAVAPDLRGFNLSSQPDTVAAYRAREIVADVRNLIDHLDYQSAIVVGHDWGGAVAWQLAAAMPAVVKRLVILNSPHPVSFARALATDPAQQAASGYMNWLRAPDAEQRLAADNFARLTGFFTRMQRADAPWLTELRLERYRDAWRHGLAGGLNYYRASPLYPPVGENPGAAALKLDVAQYIVRVPTLVLWGMRDDALLPTLLDGLEPLVPDLVITRLTAATHWLIHEEPEFIAAQVRAFIDGR